MGISTTFLMFIKMSTLSKRASFSIQEEVEETSESDSDDDDDEEGSEESGSEDEVCF